MKLEKKMATLLTAILIAMMGVMPALATTATVPLTVDVVPIISISAFPTFVDFGTPRPGTTETATITITNTGDVAVTVVAVISGAWYVSNLAITDSGYTSIAYLGHGDADLTLTIPIAATGTYAGSILFTAS